jgi:hypothetical protein
LWTRRHVLPPHPHPVQREIDFRADRQSLADDGYSLDPSDLNLPSIAVNGLSGSKTVKRTVRAIAPGSTSYVVDVSPPPGFRIKVNPTSLTLQRHRSATFEVTITAKDAVPGQWSFGSLTWRGHSNVRIPIAVNAEASPP